MAIRPARSWRRCLAPQAGEPSKRDCLSPNRNCRYTCVAGNFRFSELRNPMAAVVSNVPAMDKAGLDRFQNALSESACYLEFGTGGSTVLAAEMGVSRIYAVDTSHAWVEAVRLAIQPFPVAATIEYCDIGLVGDWGRPVSNSGMANYYRYAQIPWQQARCDGRVPDLVLIDGRFRVASFLISLMCARPGTPIIFDDYMNRKHYHVVERYCDISEIHGRLVVFRANRQFSPVDLFFDLARYSICSE